MPDHHGTASAFERFPCLPAELRLKIWQAHFDEASTVHVFSTGVLPGAHPDHTALEARSNRAAVAARDVARARLASSEADASFRRSYAGLSLDFPAGLGSLDAGSQVWIYGSLVHGPELVEDPPGNQRMLDVAAKFRRAVLERDALKAASRYLVNFHRDLLYIIDYEGGDLLSRMCAVTWLPNVQRIALAVVDFRMEGCVWNSNNMRHAILSRGAAAGSSFRDGAPGRLAEFLLVAIPPKRCVGEAFLRALERDEFGFLAFEAAGLILGSEHRRIAAQTYERVAREVRGAFPRGGTRPYRIRCVVDVDFKGLDRLAGGSAEVYSRYPR